MVYRARLGGRCEESFCCTRKFLEHYQIARNVWHLNEAAGDIAVFLFPKGNARLRQQEATIKSCALEPFRSRIRIVYLEDFVDKLRESLRPTDTQLQRNFEEFGTKYVDFSKGQSNSSPGRLLCWIEAMDKAACLLLPSLTQAEKANGLRHQTARWGMPMFLMPQPCLRMAE